LFYVLNREDRLAGIPEVFSTVGPKHGPTRVLYLDDDTDVGFDELGLLPAFGVPILAQVWFLQVLEDNCYFSVWIKRI
jgi:hypothetical protein